MRCETWQLPETRIANARFRPGLGWGACGSLRPKQETRPGRVPVEYQVDGEWLCVADIEVDSRNTLKLGAKGIQSRIDRMKKRGEIPPMRGGRKNDVIPPATCELTWREFQRPPSTQPGKRAHAWNRTIIAGDRHG